MCGNVEVKDLAPGMMDHEKNVEHVKRHGGNREEIHRCDAVTMIAQKDFPAIAFVSVLAALACNATPFVPKP